MSENVDFEKDDSRDSYRLQGKVSKSIYERVMRIREESGQTVNSLVHQMVIHALPHFESLYFPQTPSDVATSLFQNPLFRDFFVSALDQEPTPEIKSKIDQVFGQNGGQKEPNT